MNFLSLFPTLLHTACSGLTQLLTIFFPFPPRNLTSFLPAHPKKCPYVFKINQSPSPCHWVYPCPPHPYLALILYSFRFCNITLSPCTFLWPKLLFHVSLVSSWKDRLIGHRQFIASCVLLNFLPSEFHLFHAIKTTLDKFMKWPGRWTRCRLSGPSSWQVCCTGWCGQSLMLTVLLPLSPLSTSRSVPVLSPLITFLLPDHF